MAAEYVELHAGNFRTFRNAVLGATQAEMASLMGVSVPTIQAIEGLAEYRMRKNRAKTIADALGTELAEFEAVFGFAKWTDQKKVRESPWAKRLMKRLQGLRKGERSMNTTEVSLEIRKIPYFDIRIPASGWMETGPRDADDADGWEWVDKTVPNDAFALRINGDCMHPDFPSGSIIVFVPVRPGEQGEQFEAGKPYYFEHSDGKATFKLVYFEPQRERWRLQPINPDFKSMYVPEQMMARMSRAVRVIREIR